MSNKGNKIIKEIDEFDMSEFIDNYLKEEEEKRWKNEDRFNNFLEYLINYVDKHERVLSDDFYYEEEKCKPYTFREFESYLNSLYDIVNNYASKNFIFDRFGVNSENIFTDKSYCVKIKDKFYHIELVVGQGSYVAFGLTQNEENTSYVDYDLMMDDKKSPFYEHNLKKIIQSNLQHLVDELVNDGADKELVEKIIREY